MALTGLPSALRAHLNAWRFAAVDLTLLTHVRVFASLVKRPMVCSAKKSS